MVLYIHICHEGPAVHITWDPIKNDSNKVQHRLSFETASLVFKDPLVLTYQDRFTDGEMRWQTLGSVGSIVVLLVAHTYDDDLNIHIISARKATPQERKAYEAKI